MTVNDFSRSKEKPCLLRSWAWSAQTLDTCRCRRCIVYTLRRSLEDCHLRWPNPSPPDQIGKMVRIKNESPAAAANLWHSEVQKDQWLQSCVFLELMVGIILHEKEFFAFVSTSIRIPLQNKDLLLSAPFLLAAWWVWSLEPEISQAFTSSSVHPILSGDSLYRSSRVHLSKIDAQPFLPDLWTASCAVPLSCCSSEMLHCRPEKECRYCTSNFCLTLRWICSTMTGSGSI